MYLITVYNWCEVRVRMGVKNKGKPDAVPLLDEKKALELGANLLGESILFTVAAAIILFEHSRQVRDEAAKESQRQEVMEDVHNKIRHLSTKIEEKDAQLRRLMDMMAELHTSSNVIRKKDEEEKKKIG